MSLKSMSRVERTVEVGDDSFTVGPLTADLIAHLVGRYGAQVSSLMAPQGDIVHLLQQHPEIIAEVIAYCAGEPDQIATARSLPLGKQIEALVVILELTTIDLPMIERMRALIAEKSREVVALARQSQSR